MISILVSVFSAFLNPAHAFDVCETKFTLMHLAESRCFDIERPVSATDRATFRIRAALVSSDLVNTASKPTIVLLPGGPGQSAEPLIRAMQKRELINGMWGPLQANVVMFDPRGTGLSSLPADTRSYDNQVLSTELNVEDLKAVVETTSPQSPVILIAHSAGGHVALKFAEKYPALVSKMLLVSTSKSARQMGELNLALYAKEALYWSRLLNGLNVTGPRRQELDAKYLRVETVLSEQLKARILKSPDVHPNLKPISPLDFRGYVMTRMEQDPSGQKAIEFVEKYYATFAELDAEGPLLTPDSLKARLLTAADMQELTYGNAEWIQQQIMCGEGMTAEELETPIFYLGLNMRRFCEGVHIPAGVAANEPNLQAIHTRTVVLSGGLDTRVPPYIARENTAGLANTTLIVEQEADHLFFDVKPMTFFKALEGLINETNLEVQVGAL